MQDRELLSRFVLQHDHDAFAQLVRRHVHWINSMAARLVKNAALADDVTQTVFVLLARKAKSLQHHTQLSSWLFTATRYVAHNALRRENSRRAHERKAAMLRHAEEESAQWDELSPMLDELVGRLGQGDRRVVLLRFYEQKTFPEIGESLSITEDAARKRVSRAIDRLRKLFARRGVSVGAAVLSAALVENISHPASAAMITSATAAPSASAGSIALSGMMSLKPIAAVVLCAIFATAAATAIVKLATMSSVATQVNSPVVMPTTQSSEYFGEVISSDGKPVAEAQVFLVDADESAKTDAAGKFQLPFIAGKSRVLVHAVGYGLTDGFLSDSSADDPARIELCEATKLHVRLIDPDDKPAAGLRVMPNELSFQHPLAGSSSVALPQALKDQLAQTTDASGACELADLPLGSFITLDVADDRYAKFTFAEQQYLRDRKLVDVGTIKLHHASEISGKAIYADTGKPATGIPLQIIGTFGPDGASEITWNFIFGDTVTDEQGIYHVPGLRGGSYSVLPKLDKNLTRKYAVMPMQISLKDGQSLTDQNFQLITGGVVRGKVLDQQTGSPVANFQLNVLCPYSGGRWQSVFSGADGSYEVHVPPGQKVGIWAAQSSPQYLRPKDQILAGVADGQAATIDFNLQLDPNVARGKVVDEAGHPVAGVDVYVEELPDRGVGPSMQAPAVSDADGNFMIRDVNNHDALHARAGRWATDRPLIVDASNRRNLILTVHQNHQADAVVHVVQSDGKPIAGADVTLNWQSGSTGLTLAQKITDATGSCLFRSLDPDLAYSIYVAADGSGIGRSSFTVDPNQHLDLAKITLPVADSFIAGIVMDEKGQPMPGLPIYLYSTKSRQQSASTDESGHFQFKQVVSGDNAAIQLGAGEKSAKLLHVKAGTSDTVLVYVPRK